MISHILPAILILFGSVFILLAALGLISMPDLLMRMHAATKAGTLGAGFILIAVAVHFHSAQITIEALLTIAFIFITAPIASHLIARAAYFNNIKLAPETKIDELRSHYNAMTHKLDSIKRFSDKID